MAEFIYNGNTFLAPSWAYVQIKNRWSTKLYSYLQNLYNIPRGRFALDCGAAFGSEAIMFQSMYEEIHCFEPYKYNFKLLSKNIQFYDNIKVHNIALSNISGRTTFFNYDRGSGVGNIRQVGIRKTYNVIGRSLVACKTLDQFGFRHVGFIKIDVEGAEKYLLLGAKETLEKNSPLIKIEITNDHHEVLDFLQSLGYKPILYDCAGNPYMLDSSFKFNTISDDEVYWSCNNSIVKKEHLLIGRKNNNISLDFPEGMNPCYGDFWFYKI